MPFGTHIMLGFIQNVSMIFYLQLFDIYVCEWNQLKELSSRLCDVNKWFIQQEW